MGFSVEVVTSAFGTLQRQPYGGNWSHATVHAAVEVYAMWLEDTGRDWIEVQPFDNRPAWGHALVHTLRPGYNGVTLTLEQVCAERGTFRKFMEALCEGGVLQDTPLFGFYFEVMWAFDTAVGYGGAIHFG